MADYTDKVPENVDGKYYVDSSCEFCETCIELAPDNFAASEDGNYAYVFKQPATEEEEEQCQEAMDSCPVESIGDDGE